MAPKKQQVQTPEFELGDRATNIQRRGEEREESERQQRKARRGDSL